MSEHDKGFNGFNVNEMPTWLGKSASSQQMSMATPVSAASSLGAASVPGSTVNRPVPVTSDLSFATGNAKATAGIIIVATLMAASFWFYLTLILTLVVNPPTTSISGIEVQTGDAFSFGRVVLCLAASGILTRLTWTMAMSLAENSRQSSGRHLRSG